MFRQHVVDNQKSYASILKQNTAPTPQPKGDTFTFTADQLVKFVATVAIQIAQPQVCYTTAPKDAVDKKSSLCRRVSEAAKSQLGISISGNALFDAIGCIRAQCSLPPKLLLSDLNLFVSLSLTQNHLPYSNLTAPLLLLTRLSPNSLIPLHRTSPAGHLSCI